jgi:hypothetical protein
MINISDKSRARDELEWNNVHVADTNCTTCETDNDDEKGGLSIKLLQHLLTRLKITAIAGRSGLIISSRVLKYRLQQVTGVVSDAYGTAAMKNRHSLTIKVNAIDLIAPT